MHPDDTVELPTPARWRHRRPMTRTQAGLSAVAGLAVAMVVVLAPLFVAFGAPDSPGLVEVLTIAGWLLP